MASRILSISGLRGIIGDGLDPLYVTEFAAALGTMLNGGKIVLTRDGRGTGEMVRNAVVAGLTATGCEVLDGGTGGWDAGAVFIFGGVTPVDRHRVEVLVGALDHGSVADHLRHGGLDVAWRYGVHAHTVRPKIHRKLLGQT